MNKSCDEVVEYLISAQRLLSRRSARLVVVCEARDLFSLSMIMRSKAGSGISVIVNEYQLVEPSLVPCTAFPAMLLLLFHQANTPFCVSNRLSLGMRTLTLHSLIV